MLEITSCFVPLLFIPLLFVSMWIIDKWSAMSAAQRRSFFVAAPLLLVGSAVWFMSDQPPIQVVPCHEEVASNDAADDAPERLATLTMSCLRQ